MHCGGRAVREDATVPGTTEEATRGRRPGSLPALTITAGAFGILLAYWEAIGFSTFVSDPLNYWADSLYWQHPFNEFHVAGYPLLLALARGLTFDVLAPIALMTAVTGVALLAGVHGAFRLATAIGCSSRASLAAATAFGLWPFVGTVYAAFPIADALVLSLMVWAAVWAVRGRAIPAGLLLGLAAVTHKSLWPAIGLIVVLSWCWTDRGRAFGARVTAFAAAPIVALWLAGVADGESVTWILASSADDGIAPLRHSSVPVFDGLVGTVLYGDAVARARLAVVVAMVALALVVLLGSYRRWREPFPALASAFALEIIGLALVMNQHLVWSSVRFSGLLAVPAAALVATRLDAIPPRRWRLLAGAAVVVLVGTQLLTAWEGADRGWLGYV